MEWKKDKTWWYDANCEKFIVPKDDVNEFLKSALDQDLDSDTIGWYTIQNVAIMALIKNIDNDYIGFDICEMDNYFHLNMDVLYDALDDGKWNYEEC